VTRPDSNLEKPGKTTRRTRFRILAILLGLTPFCLLEIALRIPGVHVGEHDAFAEFGGGVPVFLRSGDRFRTNPAREPYLAPQDFPTDKSSRTKRLFVFGGSTVHGRPYQVSTAFPAWLKIELDARAPDHDWEIINCGGISYASHRIVPMVREAIAYQPDLIIVATGHNEFLEDRTYDKVKSRPGALRQLDSLRSVRLARQLLQSKPSAAPNAMELKTRLDEGSGYASYHRDAAWRAKVAANFDHAIIEIGETCSEAGIPLVLVGLGANLRDCPPFKSEHREGLPSAEERIWQNAFEEGAALSTNNPTAAIEAYRRALVIDSQFALLHFRIAKLLDASDPIVAGRHYALARDHDICPLRMPSDFASALRQTADSLSVPLIDAERALSSLCAPAPPGFDWYLDHVHPSIHGHQIIAQVIASDLASRELIPKLATLEEADRTRLYQSHFEALGPRYLADGRRRLTWLENWARREKLSDELKPLGAEAFLRRGFRQLDFEDFEAAFDSFTAARSMNGEATLTRLSRQVSALKLQGRPVTGERLQEWIQQN
jgi:hypothetical protein